MKNLFIKIAIVASVVSGYLNSAKAQTLTGGIDYLNSSIHCTVNGKTPDQEVFNSKQGFRIGINYSYMFNNNIGISTGLNYALKGFNLSGYDNSAPEYSIVSTAKVSVNYIDLPVLFKTRFEAGSGNIFVDLGVNFGIALNGTVTINNIETYMGTTQSTTETKDAVIGYDGNQVFKTVDLGLVAQVGYEIEKFVFTAGYNYGMTNHSSAPESVLQRQFRVGAAYKIFSEE